MRLRNRNDAPVGGFYFIMEDGTRIPEKGTRETLQKLIDAVVVRMEGNDLEIPENIGEIVEDQICMRQPPDRCWYRKALGDQLSRGIHAALGAIDTVLGTGLQPSARRCAGCGKRRNKLNQLSR